MKNKKTKLCYVLKIFLKKLNASMFLIFFSLTISSYVQEDKITLSVRNGLLENVLKKIEGQTNYLFFYNLEDVNRDKPVTIQKVNADIKDIMESISSQTGLTYKIKGRHIILKKNDLSTEFTVSSQQHRKVQGVIKDSSGEPIIGVNVKVKGSTVGAVTDVNGKFELQTSSNAVLTITYIGYLSQEIELKNKTEVSIVMKEDVKTLDDVVVIGYGTMKKRDLTGAVASVKMDDAPIGTVSTISHALAGKAAGLQVNTISAQPGGGSTFRIRGAASSDKVGNDPLLIVDGFPVSSMGDLTNVGKYGNGTTDNILASINPNDIESIEVLKDASSTAIYGARAGNGVIIVTTKRGKTGKPQVKYSGSLSVQAVAKGYEMLNGKDFMIQSNRYFKEAYLRENALAPYGSSNAQNVKPFVPRYSQDMIDNPVNDTDWFGAITRKGFQTQLNLSVMGGTDYTKYMISGNFFTQDGIVKKNTMSRYAGRINLEQIINKYVKTGVNLTLSRNLFDNVPLGSGQNENASIMVAAAQFNPILPMRDENNEYTLNTEAAFLPNPVSLLDITDKTVKERLLATAFVQVELIKDLMLKANFGIDRNYQKRKVYLPKTTLYGLKEGGKADIAQADKSDYLMELTANYSKKFKEHNLNALIGYSFQSFNYENISASNNQFLIDGFLYNNIGAGAAPKPGVGSTATKDEMASFFGRVNYSFRDRYLLTATLRADGASNFAKNNRWGYFPSVALGWRFVDESFMESIKSTFSNGKLRVSYGETGNSNIGNRAISYYQVGYNNEFGDSEHKGVYLSQIGNPNLRWETTKEWNIGLDLGFFNNRLNVTAEYFDKEVTDRLSERNLLSYHEVKVIADNIGKTQSKGFELTINSVNFATSDFSWNTDFTFSLYRDKWKQRESSWVPSAYSIYNSPLRGRYGYLSDGIIQVGEKIAHMPGSLPGQVKIKDIDGFAYNNDGSIKVDNSGKPLKTGTPDGKLNDADKVFYGNEDPNFLMGLNNTFRYKNFDMNIYFYGQFNKMNYGSYQDLWLSGTDGTTGIVNMYRGYNMPITAKEVWSHDNTAANRPGYFQDRSTWGIGDFYNRKIWFVRCRNITLGYTLPKRGLLSNLRVYLDVNNPFVLTNYKGLDPETDNSVWAYPNVRSFSLGLDITF